MCNLQFKPAGNIQIEIIVPSAVIIRYPNKHHFHWYILAQLYAIFTLQFANPSAKANQQTFELLTGQGGLY